jgi:chorismate mutase-like protein
VIDDPDIASLREQIDAIDRRLLELLAERLAVVHKVGDQKRQKGLPVYDPKREDALLSSLVARAPASLDERAVRTVFEAIVSQSRRLEEEML